MSSLPDAVLRLTQGERDHPLWRKIADHLKVRIEAERVALEDPKKDQFQTATTRGHIKALRDLLAMQDVPPIE